MLKRLRIIYEIPPKMLFSCLSMHIIFLHFSLQQRSRKITNTSGTTCSYRTRESKRKSKLGGNFSSLEKKRNKNNNALPQLQYWKSHTNENIKRDINKLADDILFHFHLELIQIIYLQCNHALHFMTSLFGALII